MKLNKRNLTKNTLVLNILFFVASLFIIIAGFWAINGSKESMNIVYSFRLFSRGHFQVINANVKAMNLLNLGIAKNSQDTLEEGLTHLETSLGFILSLQSELQIEEISNKLSKYIPVYEDMISKYEGILEKNITEKELIIARALSAKLTKLNRDFGFKESENWRDRAYAFDKIRKRNIIVTNIYWFLVVSILIAVSINIYITREGLKLEKELENQRIHMVSNSRLAALGQFSSSVAHEINNPLTVILWRLKSLNKKLNQVELPEKISKELTSIEKNSNRIDQIIKGIKTLSKNTNEDEVQKVKIISIKEQLEDILSPKLDLLELEYTFESSCYNTEITVKEVQIIQALVNLINNSIDATSTLDEKWIEVHTYQEDSQVIFTITDSGNGIPKKYRAQLFELFFTTKSANQNGTGIGLTMASQIVKAHKGKISYNASHSNTQFQINLPI